jgi:uncharacterized protein YndB with AHSA1/START domain
MDPGWSPWSNAHNDATPHTPPGRELEKEHGMSFSASTDVVIRAPRAKIWKALTEPSLVKRYFFNTDLVTDWKVGSPLYFRGTYEGKTYEDRGTVLSFEPGQSLSFNYWSSMSGEEDVPERRNVIRYSLDDVKGGVQVTIHQSNVATQERADHSVENWQGVLKGLKKLVEEQNDGT